MRGRAQLPNPGKIIAVWSAGLALLLVILGVYTVLLHSQVDALREKSPWTYLKQAEELRMQSNSAAALRMLEKAASLDPTSPEPHERAGLIYHDTKQWDLALREYRQALQLGSDKVDPRGKMIWCLIRLGRHLEAARFGERCIQEGRSTDAFSRYIGDAYRRAGENDKAIEYYEAARRTEPNDIALIQNLVDLYTAQGRMDRAESLQQRILDLESTS